MTATTKATIVSGPDLYGWKAIADFMHIGIATAKRYVRLGLPVRRWGNLVHAYSADLLAWSKPHT